MLFKSKMMFKSLALLAVVAAFRQEQEMWSGLSSCLRVKQCPSWKSLGKVLNSKDNAGCVCGTDTFDDQLEKKGEVYCANDKLVGKEEVQRLRLAESFGTLKEKPEFVVLTDYPGLDPSAGGIVAFKLTEGFAGAISASPMEPLNDKDSILKQDEQVFGKVYQLPHKDTKLVAFDIGDNKFTDLQVVSIKKRLEDFRSKHSKDNLIIGGAWDIAFQSNTKLLDGLDTSSIPVEVNTRTNVYSAFQAHATESLTVQSDVRDGFLSTFKPSRVTAQLVRTFKNLDLDNVFQKDVTLEAKDPNIIPRKSHPFPSRAVIVKIKNDKVGMVKVATLNVGGLKYPDWPLFTEKTDVDQIKRSLMMVSMQRCALLDEGHGSAFAELQEYAGNNGLQQRVFDAMYKKCRQDLAESYSREANILLKKIVEAWQFLGGPLADGSVVRIVKGLKGLFFTKEEGKKLRGELRVSVLDDHFKLSSGYAIWKDHKDEGPNKQKKWVDQVKSVAGVTDEVVRDWNAIASKKATIDDILNKLFPYYNMFFGLYYNIEQGSPNFSG